MKKYSQDAERFRTYQTHEAQRRSRRYRRQEGGQPSRMRPAIVGLPQEAQPPRPREQAIPDDDDDDEELFDIDSGSSDEDIQCKIFCSIVNDE